MHGVRVFRQRPRGAVATIPGAQIRHPSHDTFSNVFRALNPKGLEAVLRKFSKSFGVKGVVSRRQGVARSLHGGRQATPLHMVNVCAAGTRMALAQKKAPNRNEVAGAIEVLASFDLEGALVTADALHCRPDTAQAICERNGHYVLAIKSNRGRSSRLPRRCSTPPEGLREQASEEPPLTAASSVGRRSSHRHLNWRGNTASPLSLPSAASTVGALTPARRPSRRSGSFWLRVCSRPRSCSTSCARFSNSTAAACSAD
ncbi:ISAs1 family transposase [Bradyrhizobium sp. CCBAU 11386]|uniref:ISAs1 family transposase n=1 Tax=Bradyrhizobium sp. CCBAU 11386 TaxID=1630837 RepID=UPI003FA4379E